MELWIRSQDKEKLVKVDEVYIEEILDTTVFITNKYNIGEWLVECSNVILGTYKSKERALEVLDEIQKLLMPTIEYNPVVKKEESWEEEYQRTVLKGYDVKIEQAITYVYEMPKE